MGKTKSYKFQITSFIILLSVVVQTILVTCYFLQRLTIINKIYDSAYLGRAELYAENLEFIEQSIDSYMDFILGSGISDYVRAYGPLVKSDTNRALFDKGNREVEFNDVYSQIADSVYVLGDNANQYTYRYTRKDGAQYAATYVNIDMLTACGIADVLYKNNDNIFVYHKIENLRTDRLTPEETELVKKFEDELDGRCVYSRMNGTLNIFVINEDLFNFSFGADDGYPVNVTLKNKYGEVIYRNIDNELPFSFKRYRTVTNGYSKNYSLEIECADERYGLLSVLSAAAIIITALAFWCFSFFMARKYSDVVLRSYRSLSNIMRMQSDGSDISEIDIMGEGFHFGHNAIDKKIFRATLVAIIFPAAVSMLIYVGLSVSDRCAALKTDRAYYTERISDEITKKTFSILKNAADITEEDFSAFKSSYILDGTQTAEEIRLKNFILTDSEFNVIYINSQKQDYSENGYITKDLKEKISLCRQYGDRNIFLIPGNDAVYGFGGSVIVSTVRNSFNRILGYMCTVAESYAFSDIATSTATEFVVTDGNFNAFDEINRLFSDKTGVDYSVACDDIGFMHLKLCNLKCGESFVAAHNDMTANNTMAFLLIMILVLLLAWGMSFGFVSPFNKIIGDMYRNADGVSNDEKNADIDEVAHVIHSYNRLVRKVKTLMHEQVVLKTREQELVTLKTQAELAALQGQINPHFLYNTLEQINIQAISMGNTRLNEIVVALTDIFKYSTKNHNTSVTVADEIRHTENYLKIQKYRYEDKFDYKISADEETLSVAIFKLILQPLVENAFVHGFCDMIYNSVVECRIYIRENVLFIEVSDNGKGMTEDELFQLDSDIRSGNARGIGLANVYRRIILSTAGKGDMHIESEFMKGTTIILEIPINDTKKFK